MESQAFPHNGSRTTCISGLVTQNPVTSLPVTSGGGVGIAIVYAEHAKQFGDPNSVYMLCFWYSSLRPLPLKWSTVS